MSKLSNALLTLSLFKKLYHIGDSAGPQDALLLVEYFTVLADYVDNELFGAMLTFDGLTHNELSVMGRSEYNPGLSDQTQDLRRELQCGRYGNVVRDFDDRLRDAVTELREGAEEYQQDGLRFLLAVKPTVQELVSNLLTAAELVGSGAAGLTPR